MFKSLLFRLTFWHTLVFGSMAMSVFALAYYTVFVQSIHNVNSELEGKAREFSLIYQKHGSHAVQADITMETTALENDFYVRHVDKQGKTIFKTHPQQWEVSVPLPSQNKVLWLEVPLHHPDETLKVYSIALFDGGWLQVGMSLAGHHRLLWQVLLNFSWMLVLIVLLGVSSSWWQVRKALQGVDRIRRTATEIGGIDLTQRVQLDQHGDELKALATAFNGMLTRIEQAMGEVREVSNHVAHDLRTPLTRIRGMAEMVLTRGGDQNQTLGMVIEECDRLVSMINTMLELAQADSGLLHPEQAKIDMLEIVQQAHELFLPVAEDFQIKLSVESKHHHAYARGDRTRMQRVVASLLDNALKFSAPKSDVLLLVIQRKSWVEVQVMDQGMGISEDDQNHIFERFYRSDQSRSTTGNGLGLSYVKSIVRAHGGHVWVESRLGQGSVFTIQIPIMPNNI